MSRLSVSVTYLHECRRGGKYLYAVGGYHSTDTGCPAWGTSDPSDIRFIGDHLGDLVITYADGSADAVPLILGYTLWLHSTWMETPAPFMGEGKDEALAARLMPALIAALSGKLPREERSLAETLDAALGEGNATLCRRTVKESGADLT